MAREAAAWRRRSAGSFSRRRSHHASLNIFSLGIPARGSARLRELVEILDVRKRGAVHALHFGVAGFDDVILVGGVGAVAMAEPKMASGQAQRIACENVSWP